MSMELEVAWCKSSCSCSLHGFHNNIACSGLLQRLTHLSLQVCNHVLAHIWTAVQSENRSADRQQWARKNTQLVKCSFCCSSLLFLPSALSPFFLFLLFSFLSFLLFLAHTFCYCMPHTGCLFPWEGYAWRQMEQEDFSRSLKLILWGPCTMCPGAWGAVYHYPLSSIPGKNEVPGPQRALSVSMQTPFTCFPSHAWMARCYKTRFQCKMI